MNYFDTLPKELQSHIVSYTPTKTMLVSKQFKESQHQKYCDTFEPTETQLFDYMKKANQHNIPYVLYELKYAYDGTDLVYGYIVDFNNKKDLETLFVYRYYIDSDDNQQYSFEPAPYLVGKKSLLKHYMLLPGVYHTLYDHQYYDLDLFSLYQIVITYCGAYRAKQWIKNKCDTMLNYAQRVEKENDEEIDEDDWITNESQLNFYFVYMTSSASILNLWYDKLYQSTSYFKMDQYQNFGENYIIQEIKHIYQLFALYFDW